MNIQYPECGKNIESEGPSISRFLVLDFKDRYSCFDLTNRPVFRQDSYVLERADKDRRTGITHKETTCTQQGKVEALTEETTRESENPGPYVKTTSKDPS